MALSWYNKSNAANNRVYSVRHKSSSVAALYQISESFNIFYWSMESLAGYVTSAHNIDL
uniref:Uncharacterized protein n=1 Tax=Ornithodoros brasiliensis TaxID=888526 RepID=A0A1D2AJ01_ORNBR